MCEKQGQGILGCRNPFLNSDDDFVSILFTDVYHDNSIK